MTLVTSSPLWLTRFETSTGDTSCPKIRKNYQWPGIVGNNKIAPNGFYTAICLKGIGWEECHYILLKSWTKNFYFTNTFWAEICHGKETQTVHPLKLRFTTRKHRTVFCCSGWPLGHLQNGCLWEGPKGDLLPSKYKKQLGKELSNASTFRNNHPQRNSAKPAGICVLNTQRNVTFLTRPCSRNQIKRGRDCFKNCHVMQNKQHCFRNKPIVFSLRFKLGTRSFAVNSKIHGSAKDVSRKGPGFQTSKFEWLVYLQPPTLTSCSAKPLFLCRWARLWVKENMAKTL